MHDRDVAIGDVDHIIVRLNNFIYPPQIVQDFRNLVAHAHLRFVQASINGPNKSEAGPVDT